MKTQSEVTKWMRDLFAEKALYVWGMNGDVISESTINAARNAFKSAKYNNAYYDTKLNSGRGRHGADCSGAFCKLRGADDTAQGYYNQCVVKGPIANIPTDKACLVFGGSSVSGINHVGWYCGDGYIIEMKSSIDNCTKAALSSRLGTFKWYALPPWVEYDSSVAEVSSNSFIKLYQQWLNTNNLAGLVVDGIHGPKTRGASIKALQKWLGVVQTGVIDAPTAKALRSNNLKRGSKGNGVRILQGLLYCAGYDPLGFDGSFGPGCDRAVKAYQKAKGLLVDGEAGINTFTALLT